MQQFIQQANEFGRQQRPFFFLIDFEGQKPLIMSPSEAAEQGIYFALEDHTNTPNRLPSISQSDVRLGINPISFADYRQGFTLVQRQLQLGNSYLLNLTYASEITINQHLRELFGAISAPYKLYLEDQLLCFSPESFIKIQDQQITTYPMKGTISAVTQNALDQLLNDQKELQEHYTIVDLMRNDLAMVAMNIQVKRFRYAEKIATARGDIWQTSSEICGTLEENWANHIGDILATLLPAGSISGAPKTKTVDIIQAAEQGPRGYYSGVFGLFDGKSLNSAVAIRFIEQQGERYYFRSGGGITLHSDCRAEYDELCQKIYLPFK
ncbi:para-aminobenzoate synthase component I [Haemophilus pittmaniae]|uniref:Para-aminobenzoate synthase component I n=1 Tax=Haemophilus pittmaniae TaxID=249188 RepID=A0A377IZG8_9PAST|nr:aminodeoxychorismate synthase component I [Haemophilus pittmaniae]STO93499.1 para-aminobenzoate synthase component I [Haemophilus pittmaniae]